MDGMMFWVISLGLSVLVALTLVRALYRGGAAEASAAFDVQVYRDQLREVERDLARGVVTEDEADQIRTEVSRRLLDADRASQDGAGSTSAVSGPGGAIAVGVLAILVGGSWALYSRVGAPGYPDLPLETRIAMAEEARLNRPDQAALEAELPPAPPALEADPQHLELVEQLRTLLADRPDDLRGHRLLAQSEARLGNMTAAHEAQARVIAILGDAATAEDYAALAELMVLAADGAVSPEAEAALRATLTRDPENGLARYYSGLLAAQTGRPDIAFRLWRGLLEASTPDAPWVPPIRAQLEDVARLAGVDYVLPPEGRGPTSEDVAAAQDMDPAARMEMIRGMVSGLSERLATEGGPPQDWARLIRAYGVLGNRDAAAAIWAEAQEVFPDDANRVVILQAARDAGVAQ